MVMMEMIDACSEEVNEYACNTCNNGSFKEEDNTYWKEYSAADTSSWHCPQLKEIEK